MKRTLIGIAAATLLSLPILSAAQPTPIPPEAARQSPLTTQGEQDIGQQMPGPGRTSMPAMRPHEGTMDNTVSRVQEELRELGYDPGPVDGRMGPRTRQALREYQRDSNLTATGRLDSATRRKLLGDRQASLPENWRETPTATGKLLSRGDIQVAEQKLKDFGFDPGPIDGVFTAETEAALRTFQERRGIPVSGSIDEPTRRVLLRGLEPGGTGSGS